MEPGELASVLDAIGDGVYVVDPRRHITYWNSGAERLTGYTPAEAVGRWCGDGMLNHVDEVGESICGTRCPLQETMNDGERRECRVYLHHKDGYVVPVRVAATPVRDAAGTITGAVEVFVDDTEQRQARRQADQLATLALTDHLSGLGNRAYLDRVLEERLRAARGAGGTFGVLFVDVDHFKRVNDEHGHAVGDRLIRVLGTTLARNVRPGDQVARYGGEEFVVVANATGVADLVTLAERLRMLIRQSGVSVPEGRVGVTVSVGVAMAAAGDTAAMVLDRADRRLLAAKRAGRDRTVDGDGALPPA
ncbi:MAG: diguanylate cyclase [Actinomycetales bacterium]|nr:diguanylate cyclase [Actinomycetales bacterium]